jgi:molecular chaperone GrpE (heat shock protein)
MINELTKLEAILAKGISHQKNLSDALELEQSERKSELDAIFTEIFLIAQQNIDLQKPLYDWLSFKKVTVFTPTIYHISRCNIVETQPNIAMPPNEIIEVIRAGLEFREEVILKADVKVVRN